MVATDSRQVLTQGSGMGHAHRTTLMCGSVWGTLSWGSWTLFLGLELLLMPPCLRWRLVQNKLQKGNNDCTTGVLFIVHGAGENDGPANVIQEGQR